LPGVPRAGDDLSCTVRPTVVTLREGKTTMTLEPEDSDDYGYDLAHEVKTALRIPVARRQTSSYRGSGRPVDPDGGDLGYDESHDL
jgi:hypothetical protein